MRRFILDAGIAGLYLDRRQGVFERAEAENALGNRIGIAAPVLAELAFRAEGSRAGIGTFCGFIRRWTFGNCGWWTPPRPSSTVE